MGRVDILLRFASRVVLVKEVALMAHVLVVKLFIRRGCKRLTVVEYNGQFVKELRPLLLVLLHKVLGLQQFLQGLQIAA